MPDAGRVRASLLKGWLHHGPALLGAERFAAVLARIPAAAEQQIVAAARSDWIALELLDAVNAALFGVCGPEETRVLSRDLSVRLAAGPLLQPFVTAALALFGLEPAGMARRIPAAMGALYRDCGTFTVDVGPDRAVVVHDGCPAILASERLAIANGGGLESVIALCGREGRSEVEVDARRGRVVYALGWSAAGAPRAR